MLHMHVPWYDVMIYKRKKYPIRVLCIANMTNGAQNVRIAPESLLDAIELIEGTDGGRVSVGIRSVLDEQAEKIHEQIYHFVEDDAFATLSDAEIAKNHLDEEFWIEEGTQCEGIKSM